MTDLHWAAEKVREHYQALWQRGDAWALEGSEFEQQRYAFLLSKVGDRGYERALEIGCGSGRLTRLLAGVADYVLAVDVAQAAIQRAESNLSDSGPGRVEFRAVNVMEYDPAAEGPWDLVVLSETIYCLGWLYPLFNVAYLAGQLLEATRSGGRLLLANTYGREKDWLLRPSLIHTYRDLFRNVGYCVESEEVFRGRKDNVPIEVLVTLFQKSTAHSDA